MTSAQALKSLKKMGLMTAQELQKHLGVSRPTISRLVKGGAIQRLGYDLYAHPSLRIPPEQMDFALACAKFGPGSAVGGLSALFHYGLIEQPPQQVWIVVSPKKSDHNNYYRTLRTKTSPQFGIDAAKFYRITNIERTILEALNFASKIGTGLAISAARLALQRNLTSEKKIGEMAKKLKFDNVLQKYWESIVI